MSRKGKSRTRNSRINLLRLMSKRGDGVLKSPKPKPQQHNSSEEQ